MNRDWIRGNKGERIKIRSFSAFVVNIPVLQYSSILHVDMQQTATGISITNSFESHPFQVVKGSACLPFEHQSE
jgi:hypothetical protein